MKYKIGDTVFLPVIPTRFKTATEVPQRPGKSYKVRGCYTGYPTVWNPPGENYYLLERVPGTPDPGYYFLESELQYPDVKSRISAALLRGEEIEVTR